VQRRIVLLGGLAALLVVLGGGGIYAYYFSGVRSAPKQLGLSSPSPAASPTASAAPATGLSGKWAIGTGSLAGYRVNEVFVGTTTPHQAVARTSNLSGSATVGGDSGGAYQLSGITFTAGVDSLASVDQVAGRDVRLRDNVVSRSLEVQRFPSATFTASVGSVPDSVASSAVDLSVPGQLTIHGVTKSVTATGKAQLNGGRIEIAGSLPIDMRDYGVQPPQIGFTTVDSMVTIDFDLFLSRTAA
jgi:polyisoprenoid-binding protein YceI